MIRVLYEDQDIVVGYKPVNMPSQRDFSRTPDILTLLSQQLKTKLLLIHRLDRHVAGPLVFAKHKKAAAALNKQLSNQGFEKVYLAMTRPSQSILCNREEERYSFRDYLKKIKNMAEIIDEEGYNSLSVEEKKAYKLGILDAEIEQRYENSLLVRVRLLTGRFHQIRSQLSYHGLPIIGDPKYGIKEGSFIGLQCIVLGFIHPINGESIRLATYHSLGPFAKIEVKHSEHIKS